MEPTTTRSRHSVTLPPSALALVERLKVRQMGERISLGSDWSTSDFVFSQPDASPVDSNAVIHAFTRLVRNQGIPHLNFHDLSPFRESLMLKQGVNSKLVSERLGHTSELTTQDTYAHVLPKPY
jgi:integrase